MKKIRFEPMNYIIRIKIFKSPRIFYFLLVLLVISFPIFTYPRIYGVDAFQVMWMANALRDGALFSDNTWLISPLSYFGYYPFSHRAIGVPMFIAFLINLLNFCSFGAFGITEAILFFNVIIIIILYKSSRNLGDRLFEEEWSKFVFVAAILLSPNIITDTQMTVSTRIVITIVIIFLINLNIKVLNNEIRNKIKTSLYMILLLFLGALAHKLWMGTTLAIFFMLFTLIIQKYKRLKKIAVFSILPLSMLMFFIGLEFFQIDSTKIWSPFFDNSTLIGIVINLIIDYALKVGLIIIFFPIGLILTLYKLFILMKKTNYKKNLRDNNTIYFLLFIISFFFLAPSFYTIVYFLPIIIFFSIQGLIYIKKILSVYFNKFNWLFPIFLLFLGVGYSILYVELYVNINLWYMLISGAIFILTYLFMIIIYKYRKNFVEKIFVTSFNLQNWVLILALVISSLIFTTTTIVGRNTGIDSNPYPWDNRYLTGEEIEIIHYFDDVDIDELILCGAGFYIEDRLSGVGFLPFWTYDHIGGRALYYGLINPEEVQGNVDFNLLGITSFNFFYFNRAKLYPWRNSLYQVRYMNITIPEDLLLMQIVHNIQYIITTKDPLVSNDFNNWTLIQSLHNSDFFEPVYSTQHLLVWRLY